jgi:selenocysteine lyase/cysteine desulfurase
MVQHRLQETGMNGDYRNEFPVTGEWAFLNHAAVAPLSRRAHDKLVEYAHDVAYNGNVHEGNWWGQLEKNRALAARLLGARPEEIAWVKNTSQGLAFVAEGFPWKSGDNVVIPTGEYPANVYPWMHLADRGVSVRFVPTRGSQVSEIDLANALDDRTRLLSISHVQFATGFRSDLASLGRICRDRGVDFCVDAIQGLGVFPIDVEAMHIDYLSADGHKWLLAPEGAGLFYIRESKLEKIRPSCVGWKNVINFRDFHKIDFRLRPDAARFEEGTFNIPGLAALGASLALLDEIGIPTIMQRVKDTTDYLVDQLVEIGAEVISSRRRAEWSGIVSFTVPGVDPATAIPHLLSRKVVIAQRAGRLRASPHFYNSHEDIDRLIWALQELRR